MALLWFDGFENYNDYLDVNSLENLETSAGNVGFSTSYGRRSGRGIVKAGLCQIRQLSS